MYYKCINEEYFSDGMILDSDIENYGKHMGSEYNKVRMTGDFLLNMAKIYPEFPLSLFFFMLGYAKKRPVADGTLQQVMDNISIFSDERTFRLSDLVDGKIEGVATKTDLLKIHEYAACSNCSSFNAPVMWEYMAEKIRIEYYPAMPSRLQSYFLFKDEDSAMYYIEKWRENNMRIVKAEILETRNIKDFDMSKWDVYFNDMNYQEFLNAMDSYWNSYKGIFKIPEVLVQGKVRLYK